MPGGGLFPGDWERLRDSALRIAGRFQHEHPRFVEIGIDYGGTARDLIGEIKKTIKQSSFTYYGIDILPAPPLRGPQYPYIEIPSPPYVHIQSHSHYTIDRISSCMHWVFIDGDHSAPFVMRDAILYSNRLVPGGKIAFHDAAPSAQGFDGVHVRKALDSGLLVDLELILPSQDRARGGIEVYKKI